jgi:hypothetical protein
LLVDFENELDQVFVQLPKYDLTVLTAGGDIHVINETPISELFAVLRERVSKKRWSTVRIHNDLLSLRQILDFKKGSTIRWTTKGIRKKLN